MISGRVDSVEVSSDQVADRMWTLSSLVTGLFCVAFSRAQASNAADGTTRRASNPMISATTKAVEDANVDPLTTGAKVALGCISLLLAGLIFTSILILYWKRLQSLCHTGQQNPAEQQESATYSSIDCDGLGSTTFIEEIIPQESDYLEPQNDYLEPQPCTVNASCTTRDKQKELYTEAYEIFKTYNMRTVKSHRKDSKPLVPDVEGKLLAIEEDLYWEPANTVETLYAQLDEQLFVHIERSSLVLDEEIGSGQFGSVSRATWRHSGKTAVVAIKVLHSHSSEDRVRFLQESVIMGQFQHKNVVSLYGVVLEEQPVMAVLEYMANGDVKQYLKSIRDNGLDQLDNLASCLLDMARGIAEGMKYLSKKCFVHRDLAARNVMLDCQYTCKIGDFGMSRDLAEETYYITHGGKIPIRWTAPEAVIYKKYSTASDVWSYGIVLYEMWTIGEKPYGNSWSNNDVIEMIEKGYRLSPPPGCSRAIYKLMILCWHPDHHLRPTFHDITVRLAASKNELLVNSPDSEPIPGCLADCVDDAAGAYLDLQEKYATPTQ